MRSLKRKYLLMDTAGGNNEGGGGGRVETFDADYVAKLRLENAKWRAKADQSMQEENELYRNKLTESEAKLSAAEAAAKKASEDADARVKEAASAADQRIIRAELKAEALKAGMIDLDGLKLADLSKVKLNDKGEVEGAEQMMQALKESKPYLFREATNTSSSQKKPDPKDDKVKTAKEMTDAEWKEQKKKLGL